MYGNYIDEVLYAMSRTPYGSYYYVHDHLYSDDANSATQCYYIHDHLYTPAALVDAYSGNVLERYEYDVYGEPIIRAPDYELRATGHYGYHGCCVTETVVTSVGCSPASCTSQAVC